MFCFNVLCWQQEKGTLQQDEKVQYLSADIKDISHINYRNKEFCCPTEHMYLIIYSRLYNRLLNFGGITSLQNSPKTKQGFLGSQYRPERETDL